MPWLPGAASSQGAAFRTVAEYSARPSASVMCDARTEYAWSPPNVRLTVRRRSAVPVAVRVFLARCPSVIANIEIYQHIQLRVCTAGCFGVQSDLLRMIDHDCDIRCDAASAAIRRHLSGRQWGWSAGYCVCRRRPSVPLRSRLRRTRRQRRPLSAASRSGRICAPSREGEASCPLARRTRPCGGCSSRRFRVQKQRGRR